MHLTPKARMSRSLTVPSSDSHEIVLTAAAPIRHLGGVVLWRLGIAQRHRHNSDDDGRDSVRELPEMVTMAL